MNWLQKMYEKMHQKKAQLAAGTQNVILFGVLVVTTAVVGLILTNINSTQAANSIAANVTRDGGLGITSMSSLFNPLGIIIIAAVLISVLVGAFVVFRR